MHTFALLCSLSYAYLAGSVPTAYLVGRIARGIDIRRYGSGNVGATNAGQHLGKGYFLLVGAFDCAVKGGGSVLVARAFGLGLGYQVAAAVLAAIGHNWSPYLGFAGGRGLAVTLGALLLLSWELSIPLLTVALVGGWAFRNYALWFAASFALLPVWAWLLGAPEPVFWYSLAVLAVTGLKRLLSNPGTETPGVAWKQKLLPRLLLDRDTWEEGGWNRRTPGDTHKETS